LCYLFLICGFAALPASFIDGINLFLLRLSQIISIFFPGLLQGFFGLTAGYCFLNQISRAGGAGVIFAGLRCFFLFLVQGFLFRQFFFA